VRVPSKKRAVPKDSLKANGHEGPSGSFLYPTADLVIDDALNMRLASSLERGSETPGDEQASLEALGASMKRRQIQPIVCDLDPKTGRRRVRVGFRRAHAAVLAELPKVWVTPWDGPITTELLAENVGRKKVLPAEIAIEVRRLRDECELSQEAIARACGLSRASVGNYLRIVDKVHPRILETWRTRPGQFSVPDLLAILGQSHEAQLVWLRDTYGVVVPELAGREGEEGADGDGARKKIKSRRLVSAKRLAELREAIALGRYDARGENWRAGAEAVLALVLEGAEIE
jgi:ParB/RepB/Spo0J family partition protein